MLLDQDRQIFEELEFPVAQFLAYYIRAHSEESDVQPAEFMLHKPRGWVPKEENTGFQIFQAKMLAAKAKHAAKKES